MAEVAAQHAGAARALERRHQVAGAAAQVQHARARPPQDFPDAPHRVTPPPAVDLEREDVIGEVVTRRQTREHGADPRRRFALVACSSRRRALHASADRIASRTGFSSTPETIFTCPIRSGSTKCTLPRMVFLSLARREKRRSAAIPSSGGVGPYSRMVSRMSTESSAERWPVISARYTAARIPNATASPCRKRA